MKSIFTGDQILGECIYCCKNLYKYNSSSALSICNRCTGEKDEVDNNQAIRPGLILLGVDLE